MNAQRLKNVFQLFGSYPKQEMIMRMRDRTIIYIYYDIYELFVETPNLNFICLPGDMQSAKHCFFTQNILDVF